MYFEMQRKMEMYSFAARLCDLHSNTDTHAIHVSKKSVKQCATDPLVDR